MAVLLFIFTALRLQNAHIHSATIRLISSNIDYVHACECVYVYECLYTLSQYIRHETILSHTQHNNTHIKQ